MGTLVRRPVPAACAVVLAMLLTACSTAARGDLDDAGFDACETFASNYGDADTLGEQSDFARDVNADAQDSANSGMSGAGLALVAAAGTDRWQRAADNFASTCTGHGYDP